MNLDEILEIKGKKVKLTFTKEYSKYLEDNKEELESFNNWKDSALKEIGFYEKHGIEGQKDVDFTSGIVTFIGIDNDFDENTNEYSEDYYYIELDGYKWVKIDDIESIEIID